ncbi:unnamed protein product [Medioppia subpectinata]|uniref:Beta-galactosidase n=1 Tax=Medioppia subpectinata TaxID=1979941 RepID=A0A7R9KFP8_9ACAR|nr:unnamed protein product [Medioppia subpectinata]CAG2102510.1 unnamed protein product [Medioppia subpectinata]
MNGHSSSSSVATLPTNYEYYTSGGVSSGLRADSESFTLNGKQITLFSGSLHYFRLPREYWADRLTKFRAAGLNTVQTYSPWNLHEPYPGQFDFESGYLNLRAFLEACKQADLFVVYRPGPYICAEWEMGGFPAWFLRDPNLRLRSNYKPYMEAVGRYFTKVLALIDEYQFTKGGPIIALQYENEFGGIHNDGDREYFTFMKNLIDSTGFKELLINCDPGNNAINAMPNLQKGDYDGKYWKTKELIEQFITERGLPKLAAPAVPAPPKSHAYGRVDVKDYIPFDQLLSQLKPIITDKPQHMELLDLGNSYGQHYGFINYRLANLTKFKHLKLKGGASDRGVVLIDGKQVGIVTNGNDYDLEVDPSQFANTSAHTLDIIVENTGRPNGGGVMNSARRGLNGDVTIDGKIGLKYQTYPLELKEKFIQQIHTLKGQPFVAGVDSPALYRMELSVKDSPVDTFLRLDGWTKGQVFVNGFNVGRHYSSVGPQRTLYIPAPLLKTGLNQIDVFELHSATNSVVFTDKPDLG